ncbi:MAG: phosphoglycerate mutase, partial [archaeon]
MNKETKILFTVLDGAAGIPDPEHNGKTALEAAETPALDKVARNSAAGMMTVIPGTAPESDSAVLALLGYDPEKYYTGRGPLEAMGTDIGYQDGDLALRCNFATIKDKGENLLDRRVARTLTKKEAKKLERVINQEVELKGAEFEFKATQQHRGILIVKNKDNNQLSPNITNTDPAYGRKGLISIAKEEYDSKIQKCRAMEPEAKKTAQIINEFTEKTIKALKETEVNKKRREEEKLEANAIIMRDAGTKKPNLPNIEKKYGLKWTLLANMPL